MEADDGVHGSELFRYDGAVAALVADINPGSDSADLYDLMVHEGALHFVADDGVHGDEPWRSDGVDDGDGDRRPAGLRRLGLL